MATGASTSSSEPRRDKYRQIQINRERVALHDTIGQRLLESGQFEPARNEFDRALKLDPLDEAAQQGQYLAELFVALPLPTWEPAVWSAFRDPLMQLARERGQLGHVFEKYLGDVEQRIGNAVGAEQHYKQSHDQLLERARMLDPERTIYPIYTDQLTILNEFLPEQRN